MEENGVSFLNYARQIENHGAMFLLLHILYTSFPGKGEFEPKRLQIISGSLTALVQFHGNVSCEFTERKTELEIKNLLHKCRIRIS